MTDSEPSHLALTSVSHLLQPVRLEQVELFEIHLPLVEPFRISSGVTTMRRIFLLRLTDADGVVAWSECVAGDAPNYSPETIDTAWLAVREWLGPQLFGLDVDPRGMRAALDIEVRGHEMAKAALEMGAWCLSATAAGIGLSAALGGTRERIETGISLGIQSAPEALVSRAARALEEGYRKIKIKIKPGADVEFVGAVREALGDDAPLMADANNAYDLYATDERGVRPLLELDELGLVMIEQPLAWDDVVRHRHLQAQLRTPVCLDESITSVAKAEDMIELDAGRIVNIKPGRVGGYAESVRIHDLCRAHDLAVWCGGMLESGIGRAYNVALASLPGFTIPGDVSPSARYWKQDVVSPEWTMDEAGTVGVPTGPGLGVEVDEERIRGLAVRSEVLTSPG